MGADAKAEPRSMISRLVFTVAGALLMVGPPYVFEILDLSTRLQSTMILATEFASLIVGFVLLYLAFRRQEPEK